MARARGVRAGRGGSRVTGRWNGREDGKGTGKDGKGRSMQDGLEKCTAAQAGQMGLRSNVNVWIWCCGSVYICKVKES